MPTVPRFISEAPLPSGAEQPFPLVSGAGAGMQALGSMITNVATQAGVVAAQYEARERETAAYVKGTTAALSLEQDLDALTTDLQQRSTAADFRPEYNKQSDQLFQNALESLRDNPRAQRHFLTTAGPSLRQHQQTAITLSAKRLTEEGKALVEHQMRTLTTDFIDGRIPNLPLVVGDLANNLIERSLLPAHQRDEFIARTTEELNVSRIMHLARTSPTFIHDQISHTTDGLLEYTDAKGLPRKLGPDQMKMVNDAIHDTLTKNLVREDTGQVQDRKLVEQKHAAFERSVVDVALDPARGIDAAYTMIEENRSSYPAETVTRALSILDKVEKARENQNVDKKVLTMLMEAVRDTRLPDKDVRDLVTNAFINQQITETNYKMLFNERDQTQRDKREGRSELNREMTRFVDAAKDAISLPQAGTLFKDLQDRLKGELVIAAWKQLKVPSKQSVEERISVLRDQHISFLEHEARTRFHQTFARNQRHLATQVPEDLITTIAILQQSRIIPATDANLLIYGLQQGWYTPPQIRPTPAAPTPAPAGGGETIQPARKPAAKPPQQFR